MRRIAKTLRNERGATAVIVGILLVPLTGGLAIALDVGALYVERGQLQNGADAAALAIAQECAEDGNCDAPVALASIFSDANANDGAANNLVPTFPNDHTVVVTTSTLEADTGSNALHHPFAALLGIDSSTVVASATAEWGPPQSSTVVLPLALSYCEWNSSLVEPGELMLIRYDTNVTCKGRDGHPIPGGFGWLDRPGGGCEADIDLINATVNSEPGNSYPGACDDTMLDIAGATILVPIFDGAVNEKGRVKAYTLWGFAAFTVTGWRFSGGGYPQVSIDPDAPSCSGACRGIQGYFTNYVSLEEAGDVELGGPNLGVTIVRLID